MVIRAAWMRAALVAALMLSCAGVVRGQGPAPGGVVRYVELDLGPTGEELIGVQITAEALRSALGLIPERSGPDLLVLRFRCEGGMLREVPRLADLIMEEMRRGVRVVAWVEEATSAAALTALACPEIVMTSGGTIGAAVTYEMRRGEAVALEGEELGRALSVGAEISRRMGRDARIVRAMQTPTALSYDVGERGAVELEDGTGGRVLLSAEGSILTMAAPQAQEIGLSLGTADTIQGVLGLLGVARAQDVGMIARGLFERKSARASEALVRMRASEVELWDALDRASVAEDGESRAAEVLSAGEALATLKRDVGDWPDIAAYLGLSETTLGAYSHQVSEMGKAGE